MKILRVDPRRPDRAAIDEAARVIRAGGVVAFPTETVYGLGADALDADAIRRIYAAKGRPSYNPLIVHCANVVAARRLAQAWPESAQRLAEKYWPGPLTLVVRKAAEIPDEVTAGLPTVALRVPDHPVAAALLVASGTPIAAPSANRFTELSPTTAEHVIKSLGDAVDLVLDGGPTAVGIESTIVDVTGAAPVILRPGSIDEAGISGALDRSLTARPSFEPTAARPAPGMTPRHYAPRANLNLIPTGDSAALEAAYEASRGGRVAAMVRGLKGPTGLDRVVTMPATPAEYARRLYAILHLLDDEGHEVVLVEQPPETPEWAGVNDRLRRAAYRP